MILRQRLGVGVVVTVAGTRVTVGTVVAVAVGAVVTVGAVVAVVTGCVGLTGYRS